MRPKLEPRQLDDPAFLAGFVSGMLFGRDPPFLDVEKEAIIASLSPSVLELLATDDRVNRALIPGRWREFIHETLKRRGN